MFEPIAKGTVEVRPEFREALKVLKPLTPRAIFWRLVGKLFRRFDWRYRGLRFEAIREPFEVFEAHFSVTPSGPNFMIRFPADGIRKPLAILREKANDGP